MEDEIVINGEVYVRKNANLSSAPNPPSPGPGLISISSASAVDSLQEKLNRRKLVTNGNGNIEAGDTTDGMTGAVSVLRIKQKLR